MSSSPELPSRVLVDSNVIVDLLEMREPFADDALTIFETATRNAVVLVVTAKQLADVHYLASSARHSRADASNLLRKLVRMVVVIDTTAGDVETSLARNFVDFEDGLLIAAAERLALDAIVTRDSSDFADSHVPVISPSELAAML